MRPIVLTSMRREEGGEGEALLTTMGEELVLHERSIRVTSVPSDIPVFTHFK